MYTAIKINKSISYWHFLLLLCLATFIMWTPHAEAKIVIKGDREFTDDINECLNTYRGAAGVVGDVIKELEASDNEHTILNTPAWNNSSNDLDAATGGDGSGTVTRVDKKKLEEYVKKIDSLKNKDFCTALLHELYHAVDADRGTRTPHSDKVDGAKRNEIEATLFQNLIHALRGVPPRTHYGGIDISEHVVIGNGEIPQEPPAEETETPEEVKKEEPKEVAVKTAMSFTHVKPGEYSEVYMDITGEPGTKALVSLKGPSVDSADATGEIGANGTLRLTWKIYSYGKYSALGTAGGQSVQGTTDVK